MVVIEGIKYACERCIRGHRVSSCTHTQQPLIRIKPKGRPATQCLHCREARKNKALHVKCKCGSGTSKHAATCPCYSGGGCICTNKHPQVLPPNSTTTGANGCIVINKAALEKDGALTPQMSPEVQTPQMPHQHHSPIQLSPVQQQQALPINAQPRASSATPSLSPQPVSPHSPESALKSVNFTPMRTNSSSSLSSMRNKNRVEKVRPSQHSMGLANQLANSPSSPFYAVTPPAWVDSPTLVPTGPVDAYLQIINDELSSPLLDSEVFSSLDMEQPSQRALASTDINNRQGFESTSPSSILSSWNLWGNEISEMEVPLTASASASSIQTPPSSTTTPDWTNQPCSVSPADVMLPFKHDDQDSVFLTEPLYL